MRRCKTCGDTKPMDAFPPYKAKGTVGRRHTCRVCWNAKWSPIVAAHGARYYHENQAGTRDRVQKATRAQVRTMSREAIRDRNAAYVARYPERAAARIAVAAAVRSDSRGRSAATCRAAAAA